LGNFTHCIDVDQIRREYIQNTKCLDVLTMTDFHFSRRQVLKTGVGLAASLGLPGAVWAMGSAKIGTKELTVLSDGNLSLPLDFVFPNVPRAMIEKLLAEAGQPTDVLAPDCNVTLLRDGDRLILFDVGAGKNFMPSAGKLDDSLAGAGFDPSEVTDVVFTHAHPDHIWGLVDDFDELIFSNANYYMNSMEWDYWRREDTLENTPEARKTFVIGARNRFDYLEDRIQFFNYGDEVLSGIEAVDTSGHTPGHTSFAIHDGNESIMVIGDAVTNVAVSFQHPEWPSGSDQDVELGIRTRIALLDRLASDKMGVVGFHMPHPGLGRVEKSATAYRFAKS
jgi:glyoxylase-like metal-dependent hydrolase (beta-lactamase superfamily II)